MNKGESPLLSGALYVAIIGAVLMIVINALTPPLKEKYEESKLYHSFNCLSYLHNSIIEVWNYAPGSEKEIRCAFEEGNMKIKDNMLLWTFDHNPSFHFKSLGDAKEYKDINLSQVGSYYILENKVLRINVTRIGTKDSLQPLNVSEVINEVYNKVYGVTLQGNKIRILLDNESCESGNGYVHTKDTSIIISVQPSLCLPYDLILKLLDKNQDFVEISATIPSTNF